MQFTSRIGLILLFISAARFGWAEGIPQQRLGRLEAGVQAEEAIRSIKRLQHSYSHYLEYGLWSDLGDLFTENAAGEFKGDSIEGKANLRKHFMEQAERTSPGLAKGQLNTHLILQPIVTLGPDGKTAKGTWHEIAMLGKLGDHAKWLGGVYENEYVYETGVWKISRMRYFQQYSGAYEEWGHKAPPRWDIPYHFEAEHVGVTIPETALKSLMPALSGKPSASLMAGLAKRVQRLNDETEVQNLQHSFGYYLDRKMWDDVADLFTQNGSFEVAARGVYAGKAHIRRALETLYGASPLRKGELFDHINLATVVTIAFDGRIAGARTTQLCMLGLNGSYAEWELGIYENEFVKEDDVWKFKAVHYYPRMASDYDKGWGKEAKPIPATSKEFPPDRLSVQPYRSYPELYYVAFHYPNPVTDRPVQYPPGDGTSARVIEQENPARITNRNKYTLNDALLMELEHKLDSAIGADAVENLNSSYGYYMDESAWDQMAATFANTGSKEITGAGVYIGRERIRKVLNLRGPRGGRTPDFFTIHQLTQPVIHISEDGNSAKARLRLFQCGGNSNGSSGSWIGGIYENTAVKENGEWKFGVQDLHHMYNASYRNGWARVGTTISSNAGTPTPPAGRNLQGGGIQQGLGGAASPARIVTEFPPDKPIRSKQYAFPEIVEPAFHYKNPVSGRVPAELLP